VAWTTNPYTTLADVKTALDLQNTDSDSWLQTLMDEAQADIDRYIGYSFQTDGTTGSPASRYYDGNNHAKLWIDDCQSLVQVLETTYNVLLGSNGVWTNQNPQTVDITADIAAYPYNETPVYLLSRLSGLPFQFGRKNYQVFGIFGYPDIPTPISRACKLLTIHYFKRRDATYGNRTANRQYGSKTFQPMDMPDEVTCVLERYRERLFLSHP
jgi:hypothetical protein